ncbi:hypothetical protein ACHAXR_002100, partial [Thalassiosira sp. AJA248-18]
MNKENQVNADGNVAAQTTAKLCHLKMTHRAESGNQQACMFVSQVKEAFGDKSSEYRAFSKILKDFTAKTVPTQEVVERILDLFQGKRDLILGFNEFLPLEHKIRLPPKKAVASSPALATSFSSLVQQLHQPSAPLPPSATGGSEVPAPYEEEPSLETELAAIEQLQQELELLTEKRRLFLLQEKEPLSKNKQNELEEIEWQAIVVRETIGNIKLGIKLRSKEVPNMSGHRTQRERAVASSDHSSSRRSSSPQDRAVRDTTTRLQSSRDLLNADPPSRGDNVTELREKMKSMAQADPIMGCRNTSPVTENPTETRNVLGERIEKDRFTDQNDTPKNVPVVNNAKTTATK